MEHNVVKLVNATDRRRVISSVCSCLPADSLKSLLKPDVPLYEFNRRDGNDPGIVGKMIRLMRRDRPDIVHSHTWGSLCESFIAARVARVPVIIHGEHGTMNLRPRNRFVQRLLWKRVDRLLSVSSTLAHTMSREVGVDPSRIGVIYNGVSLERFAEGDGRRVRHELKVADDERVIATVGRLEPVKDHSTLIAAASMLKQASARFRLVLVGEGTLRERLETEVAHFGLADQTHFLGHRDDVEHVLAAADVFVLSSWSEGLPNGIMEAMAAGVAVVSTAVGGATELVVDGTTGILVPARSPEALATAISSLLSDESRRAAFGEAGRRRATEQFAFAQMVHHYENLYLSTARASSRLARLFGAH
jgi:sugar transferase (PEP-CTERM/EpsH1 system associated)